MLSSLIQIIILSACLFFLFVVLRQILFFGFAPFFPASPEVMEKIVQEITVGENYAVCSLGYGRSGFLRTVEKKYPGLKLTGFEDNLFHCLITRLQILLHGSRIRVKWCDYYHCDISRFNVVYCRLDVKRLRELSQKLKMEPRAGAMVISNGFVIPYLDHVKILKIKPKKRWFAFLTGGGEKVLTEKEKEYKPDDNVYFYEV